MPKVTEEELVARIRGEITDSLGYGDVDFELALKSLNKVSYSGPLILETFRDRSYMSYATDNMRFLLTKLKKVNKRIS